MSKPSLRRALDRRLAAMCMLVGAVGFVACVDNATRLSGRVRREVSRLGAAGADLETVVPYRPVRDNQRPYWLVFLPGWRVSVADLSAAGLDEEPAERIFRELGYVGFGDADGPDLVVAQDGRRLHFTSTGWAARADRVLVARGRGPCGIVLRRHAAAWKIVAVRW